MIVSQMVWIFTLMVLSFFNCSQAESPNTSKVKASPIKIGMVIDLSGAAKVTGQGFKKGTEIYFARVNENGGIQGRELKLIAFDDLYEPAKSGKFVRQLVEDPEILALTGNTGAPNMEIVVPIVNEKKILLYAASTGGSILRKTPPDRYVFNFRESHVEEAEQLVDGALSLGYKPEEFAVFTQNDPFGDNVFEGAKLALSKKGLSDPDLIPHGRYTSNTLYVEDGFVQIVLNSKNPPKVILLGGNASANSKFINLAHKKFPHAIFLVIGGYLNIEDIENSHEILIIADQLVPPLTSDVPAIREFHEDLKKYGNGAVGIYYVLQGYLATKLFVVALTKAVEENKLTREGIIDVFESLHDVDIGIGKKISFDKNNHQALHTMWPTLLKGDAWVPLENWSELYTNKLEN